MAQFEDNQDRTWVVSLNVDTVKRVRRLCQVDLLDVDGLSRLATDAVALCDVLYVICQEQAEKANVTDEEFGRGMAGDAIEAASAALVEEISNFFPSRLRGVLKKATAKMSKLQDVMLEAAEAKIESGELEEAVKRLMLGESSTSSPESSGSIPAPSP